MLEPPLPRSQPSPDLGWAAPDHRRASEDQLLAALRGADLLALAEAWRRTAPAAHAVSRRLLGPGDDVETVLRLVYADLWREPLGGDGVPASSLERWVRSRAFTLSAELLRAGGRAPAALSVAPLLPDLPPPHHPADTLERLLAGLPRDAALALVRAHDAGLPTADHADPSAGDALEHALVVLAHDPAEFAGETDGAARGLGLGDFVLGLLPPAETGQLERLVTSRPALADHVRLLRRGRRRIEGLPPAPELGPRTLLGVVAATGAAPSDGPRAAMTTNLDEDVVITVGRQSQTSESPGSAAEQDTGPIGLVTVSGARNADGDVPHPAWTHDHSTDADEPTATPRTRAHHRARAGGPEPIAPRVRRGTGLLLVGTALGMLIGALSMVLR